MQDGRGKTRLAVKMPRQWVLVGAVVITAFLARALTIWLYRAEFTGWFNHSYYYWVQTRGLLETGLLPFDDMPLLFYLYAAVASVLQYFGVDQNAAIVHASRMLMSLFPALVALPVFRIAQQINRQQPLRNRQWVIIAVCAFLPLSFAHMPEILQKNTLGMLLLATLLYACLVLLQKPAARWLVYLVTVFALITLTHLGTFAAASLAMISLVLAYSWCEQDSGRRLSVILLTAAVCAFGVIAVYLLDPDAFARILRYSASSIGNSLLGKLFTTSPSAMSLALLAGILMPLVLVAFLFQSFRRFGGSLDFALRVFWLANIILAYLLVLPVVDLDILPRLLLFVPLPLAVVVLFQQAFDSRRRISMLLTGAAAVGAGMMLLGESQNLLRMYPDKHEILAELQSLKQQFSLNENDLVLGPYAVAPACNWFLDTKASLVTSFNRDDIKKYDRLFVLNTTDQPPSGTARRVDTEPQKYVVMRQQIPLPTSIHPAPGYQHLQFYQLEEIPASWQFDASGNWSGWSDSSQPRTDQ